MAGSFIPLSDERDTLYMGWRTRDLTTLRRDFVHVLSDVAAHLEASARSPRRTDRGDAS